MVDEKVKDDTAEGKVYSEKEYGGIIRDLQSERSNRQQVQFDLEQSRRENESLKKTVQDAQAKKDEKLIVDDVEFEGEPGDFVSKGEIKKHLGEFEKAAVKKFTDAQKVVAEKTEQDTLKTNFRSSCQDAITKYAGLKDIGLDFDTVYRAAIRLIGGNQYEEMAIFHSKDPGERLYKKGCEDPEVKMKLDLEENQEILKIMETRKVDKKSLVGSTKTGDKDYFTPQEVALMKPKEAQANLAKIEKSMEKW